MEIYKKIKKKVYRMKNWIYFMGIIIKNIFTKYLILILYIQH